MTGLFVALGIAILTLIAILLWFVPHLLQQQALQVAEDTAQLREMIGEIVNEHEAVSMRQVQLGTSISYLQDQLEQVITINVSDEGESQYLLATADPDTLNAVQERVHQLEQQLAAYIKAQQAYTDQDNESWVYLIGLLSAIQDRIRTYPDDYEHLVASLAAHSNCKPYANGTNAD